jgi:hypothetical protein
MNERTLRPGNVAAAAVLIGAVVVIVMPQHAMSVVQLVAVTVAAACGLYALSVRVPPTGWMSPFRWMSPFDRTAAQGWQGHRSDEVDLIRSKLSGRRQRVEGGPPTPPEVLRLVQPLIRAALDLDPGDDAGLASARALVSPLTWAVLTGEALRQPPWFRTLGPNGREVAEVVHAVLDDLDRLSAGATAAIQPIDFGPGRAP